MDFTPEELDLSSPCLLVENSQSQETETIFRSDSACDLAILKQLTRLSTSRTDPSAGISCDHPSFPRNCAAISCSTTGGEGVRREEGEKSRQPDDRGQHGQGRDSSGGNDRGGSDGGGGDDNGSRDDGGDEGGGGDAGGGDGGGGDDNDNDENNEQDPSANEEESPHPDEPSSSSDTLPELIRPPEVATLSEPLVRVVVTDSTPPRQHVSGEGRGSVHDFSGDNYSEASTGVVGEGADVASDLSEVSTAPVDEEKKSTCSSSVGHKSDHGSAMSSSSYHGDLSNLSSESGSQVSPEVRKHLPQLLRKQSTSDTSTSSAGSKEEKVHAKVTGYTLWSMEEEQEGCSSQEDMFASSQGHQEGTTRPNLLVDLKLPQHQSTPVDDKNSRESHPSERSLYKQVFTSKQRTSTPVEGGGGFFCTPPSQETPIDNVAFQSLQFSGEPSVRVSSSSSSDKVHPSPDAYSSVQDLHPSSPTAAAEEQVEKKSNRKEGTYEKGCEDRQTQKSKNIKESVKNDVEKEQSEMSKAAAELLQSFDMSQSQERHLEKPESLRLRESLDDERVELPLWQQKQQQEALQQASDTNEKKSSDTSSKGSSSEDSSKGESSPQLQQWQPVSSALSNSSLGSTGSKGKYTVLPPNGSKEQCVPFISGSFLDSPKHEPLISDLPVDHPKQSLHEEQLSLSPSSLIMYPFEPSKSKAEGTEESPAVLPGPTQPEMSEDMFFPVINQEGKEQKSISDESPDQPMEEQNIQGVLDSQDIVMPFSLHLTQSQLVMGSQMPSDTSQGLEGIQEDVIVSEVTNNVTECKLAETIQAEEASTLTKQDSGSQSILAPLGRQLPTMALAQDDNDKEQLTMNVPTKAPENLVRSTDGIDEIHRDQGTYPFTDRGDVIHPPEKTAPVEESGGVTQPVEQEAPDDLIQEQASIPEKGTEIIFWEKDTSDDIEKEQSSTAGVHARKPIKPTLPAAIFSESSSDSGTSFHFSLPREPLRPLTSTTPPPFRPVSPDTPDSEERSSRRSTIPDVALPVVRETPGMSSQEVAFHFEPSQPRASTSTESLDRPHSNAPVPPRSIFSRARKAIAKTKKRGMREVQSDDDPFAFTAEDDVPEPVRKKPKRGSPRGTRGKEIRPRAEVKNITSTKRVREEREASSESEGLEEALSKRFRREDDELKPDKGEAVKATSSGAVHYKQIMRTCTVTTVTTQVKRNVTMTIVDEESGEVVQVFTFEEDGEPKVESQEEEKEEVTKFVETSNVDGSRVKVTAKTPKQDELQQQNRSSPRRKSSKSPASKQATRASGKTQALVISGQGDSDRSSEDGGKGQDDNQHTRGEPTEIPSISRQDTEPILEKESNLKRSSSSDSSLTPGTPVLAKWLDGYFYPGIITAKQYKNGRYSVTFDDGDKRRIPRENLIIKDLLPVGQSVMAQGDLVDDFYEEGVIVGHYRDRNARGYEIQTQNGAIRRYPRSRIILSEQQAVAVLSSDSSFSVTSGSSVSIGAHSLRRAGSSNVSLHDVSKSGGIDAKDTSRDTSSKDTSPNDERTQEKNADRASPRVGPRRSKVASADMDITPKSTHKSSHKIKAQARRAGHRIGESESSSDEQHGKAGGKRRYVRRGLSSTYGPKSPARPVGTIPAQPVRGRTPRKQISDRKDTVEAPHLPRNRNTFAGLAFLVTGVTRDKDEPEETDSESERIDFNRHHLKRQIEAGGGVVLSSFPQSQISGAECFLISHTHQRTQKYFQSLASGIPCVSHMWINDCCACDKRLDYKKYLLPAGESLEAGEIVECRPRRNILGDMRVYLHGSQQFKDTWSSVLLAAGCRMVAKLPGRVDYECDVIICEDHKLPASVKHAANLLAIPIVSLEWLLQTLINGRQVPFDGHPKYDYRCKNS